jgi:hypothetical protein
VQRHHEDRQQPRDELRTHPPIPPTPTPPTKMPPIRALFSLNDPPARALRKAGRGLCSRRSRSIFTPPLMEADGGGHKRTLGHGQSPQTTYIRAEASTIATQQAPGCGDAVRGLPDTGRKERALATSLRAFQAVRGNSLHLFGPGESVLPGPLPRAKLAGCAVRTFLIAAVDMPKFMQAGSVVV